MALLGGLSKRPDGRSVLQVYVDAADVKQLLELGEDRYQQYEGSGFNVDIGADHDIAEVWLSVVPDDGSSHVIRPTGLDPPGESGTPWIRVELT